MVCTCERQEFHSSDENGSNLIQFTRLDLDTGEYTQINSDPFENFTTNALRIVTTGNCMYFYAVSDDVGVAADKLTIFKRMVYSKKDNRISITDMSDAFNAVAAKLNTASSEAEAVKAHFVQLSVIRMFRV